MNALEEATQIIKQADEEIVTVHFTFPVPLKFAVEFEKHILQSYSAFSRKEHKFL